MHRRHPLTLALLALSLVTAAACSQGADTPEPAALPAAAPVTAKPNKGANSSSSGSGETGSSSISSSSGGGAHVDAGADASAPHDAGAAVVDAAPSGNACEQRGGTCQGVPAILSCKNPSGDGDSQGCTGDTQYCCLPGDPPYDPQTCTNQGGQCVSASDDDACDDGNPVAAQCGANAYCCVDD